MKREKRCKIEWGSEGCTIEELRDALDVIENDLGSSCSITFYPVTDRNKAPSTQGKDGMAYIAAIAGYSEVGE